MIRLFLTWLLIQAVVVDTNLQLANDGSILRWTEWSPCRVYEECPDGRQERRRLCDVCEINCAKNKLVQIRKCYVKTCKRDSTYEAVEKEFTHWTPFPSNELRIVPDQEYKGESVSNNIKTNSVHQHNEKTVSRFNKRKLEPVPPYKERLVSPRLKDLKLEDIRKYKEKLISLLNHLETIEGNHRVIPLKLKRITGNTRVPKKTEPLYGLTHQYDENDDVKYSLTPYTYHNQKVPTSLEKASKTHGTTGLTYLICAVLFQMGLHVLTYLYIYRKGCCVKKVHESFGKNRKRRTFKDSAKLLLGQGATDWIYRKTKTIFKRQDASNRTNNSNDIFNGKDGEYDEEGYLLGQPLCDLVKGDVEINLDHFDSSRLKRSFEDFHADVKDILSNCIIKDPKPSAGSKNEENFAPRSSILKLNELHLCEHVKTGNLIDFNDEKSNEYISCRNDKPSHNLPELNVGNSPHMNDGKHDSPRKYDPIGIVLQTRNILPSIDPPPKEGMYITGNINLGAEENSGSITCSGTPTRAGLNTNFPFNNARHSNHNLEGKTKHQTTTLAGNVQKSVTVNVKPENVLADSFELIDGTTPQKNTPVFDGESSLVKEECKSNASASNKTPTFTEMSQHHASSQNDSIQKDKNPVKKSDDHKVSNKAERTVKSRDLPSINKMKSEQIDDTLKQPEASKSTRSLQVKSSKRFRFSFIRRKNKSADCLETDASKKIKKEEEKKSRSFFSRFRKKKSSKKDSEKLETNTENNNSYQNNNFVITKRYTKDFRLDPSPSAASSHNVTSVSSCQSLRSDSMERLKWQSRRRSSSLNDLGLDVKKESSRFL